MTEAGGGAGTESCERCGGRIETTDWHPVSKHQDSDHGIQLYAFCSEACKDAWQAEHSE